MPTADAHISLAKRNQDVLDILGKTLTENPEWVATVAFYKAVHIAEAIFDHAEGKHSVDHGDRNYDLKRRYQKIWSYYSSLYSTSIVARYLGDGNKSYLSFSHFKNHSYVSNLVTHHLKKIEEEANRLLGADHF